MTGQTHLSVNELASILAAVFEQNSMKASTLQFVDAEGEAVIVDRVIVSHEAKSLAVSVLPHAEETRRSIMSMLYPPLPNSMGSLHGGSTKQR